MFHPSWELDMHGPDLCSVLLLQLLCALTDIFLNTRTCLKLVTLALAGVPSGWRDDFPVIIVNTNSLLPSVGQRWTITWHWNILESCCSKFAALSGGNQTCWAAYFHSGKFPVNILKVMFRKASASLSIGLQNLKPCLLKASLDLINSFVTTLSMNINVTHLISLFYSTSKALIKLVNAINT